MYKQTRSLKAEVLSILAVVVRKNQTTTTTNPSEIKTEVHILILKNGLGIMTWERFANTVTDTVLQHVFLHPWLLGPEAG